MVMKNLAQLIIILLITGASSAYAKEILCSPNEYLVREHPRSGYLRSDGTWVRSTNVDSYCKVRTKAYEYSKNIFKRDRPEEWPHKNEQGSTWTEEQKDRAVDALEEHPDLLLSPKIKGIYRLKNSKDPNNPASSSEGVVVLYDSAFTDTRGLERILVHELAHQNYRELDSESLQDYRLAAGWKRKLVDRLFYWVPRDGGYVEEDGQSSIDEDYANNIEFYLYDSAKLKNMTPKVHDWIKKHFGDSFKLNRRQK